MTLLFWEPVSRFVFLVLSKRVVFFSAHVTSHFVRLVLLYDLRHLSLHYVFLDHLAAFNYHQFPFAKS